MKILVTAGSTRTMIDQVRCITNIFKGKTGASIARHFVEQGHNVTLLSSAPLLSLMNGIVSVNYHTYEDLYNKMHELIVGEEWDVIIHSAAVSDYKPVGTYVDEGGPYTSLKELDSSGKVGSDHKCLYLKMVQTEKIIDKIRDPWGFKGKLVKFKLQVDMTDEDLLDIARESCAHSDADFIVANCLEWSSERAYIMSKEGSTMRVERTDLPKTLYEALSS